MNPPALSIVIPVFNSSATLPELVGEIEKLHIEGGHELVLVNDGSRDDSADVAWELAHSAACPVTVVDLSRNFGEHNAVMAGLHQARGRHVVIMDDDLQNPVEAIPGLLEHAERTEADVVYTYSRFKQHAMWRNAGSWVVNRMADVLLDKPQGLYLSSFKCLTSRVVGEVIQYRGPFPYLDGLIFQVSDRVDSLEVAHGDRRVGRSGYTMRKLVRLGLGMLVNFSVMPLRLATLLGLTLALLGLAGVVPVALEALFFATPLGWGSLMAALLVFSGIQLMMLGLLGEYLGRIYLTINQKPQFSVRRVRQCGS